MLGPVSSLATAGGVTLTFSATATGTLGGGIALSPQNIVTPGFVADGSSLAFGTDDRANPVYTFTFSEPVENLSFTDRNHDIDEDFILSVTPTSVTSPLFVIGNQVGSGVNGVKSSIITFAGPLTTFTVTNVNQGTGLGYAFDNFAFEIAPEPGTAMLMASGLLAIVALQARQRGSLRRRPTNPQ